VDVKFIAPLSATSRKKYYPFTATDDCTRVRVLRIYDQLNQKTAIEFADYVLDKGSAPGWLTLGVDGVQAASAVV
jgi:hypothetical protein